MHETVVQSPVESSTFLTKFTAPTEQGNVNSTEVVNFFKSFNINKGSELVLDLAQDIQEVAALYRLLPS